MIENRVGDWMQTAGGRQFWPLDPRADEVHLDDIAHALANMCRFGGHCRTFYSVAEHSVRVSLIVPPEDALAGLLHDAAEAYVVDVPRPLKRFLQGYSTIERAVEAAVLARFGLSASLPASVKIADEVLLATEARDLMGGESAGRWYLAAEPLAERIAPWSPGKARHAFLDRFGALTETAPLAPSEVSRG